MSTLCLSDMGELRDEWLREPQPASLASAAPGDVPSPALAAPSLAVFLPDHEAVAA